MAVGGSGSPISAAIQLDLAQLKSQVDAAIAQTDRLGKSLANLPTPKVALDTKALEASSAQAQASMGGLAERLRGLPIGTPSLDTKSLETAGQSANTILKQVSGGLLDVGNAAKLGGAGIAVLATTATVELLKMGAAYDAAQRSLQVSTGATGEALASLETSLAHLNANSPKSITELASAMAIVHQRTGELGGELEGTTSRILKFARATGQDATEALQGMTRIFSAFGVTVADQGKTLDAFLHVQQATGISQSALQEGVRSTGAVLRQFGLSVVESAAFVGKLDQAGADAGQAVFGLRRALGNLQGEDAKKALGEIFDAIGNAKDGTLAYQTALDIFGPRSAAVIVDLAKQHKLSYQSLADDANNAAGAVDDAASRTKTAADRLAAAAKVAEKAWAPVGLAMFEAGSQIVDGVVKGLSQAGTAIDDFLAKPSTRALAAYLQAIGRAGQEGTGPRPPPGPPTPGAVVSAAPSRAPLLPTPLSDEGQADLQKQLDDDLVKRGVITEALIAQQQGLTTATEEANAAGTDWDAKLRTIQQTMADGTKGAIDFAKALELAGTDQGKIEGVLQLQKQYEDLDHAIKTLSDQGIVAYLIAQEKLANNSKDAAERQGILDQATQVYSAHLAAQTATQEQATAAQRQAEAAIKATTDAQTKAAGEGGALYQRRLTELAETALPGLTAAETARLKGMEDTSDLQGLLTLVTEKYGLAAADVRAILAGTNADFDAHKKQLADTTKATQEHAAATKSLADTYTDELKGRASGALGSLASATDAASAANAKFLESQGKTNEALQGLLQRAGATPAAIQGITDGLNAGGAAAFDAQEKVKNLVTYVRDQYGQVRLKIDVDIDAARAQIAKISQDATAALSKGLNEPGSGGPIKQQLDLQTAFQKSMGDLARQSSDLGTDTRRQLLDVQDARAQAGADLSRSLAATSAALTATLRDNSKATTDTIDKYHQGLGDAQTKLSEQFRDAALKYGDGVANLADQAKKATQQLTDAQVGALRQLAAAMQAANDQAITSAAQASITRQNNLLQQFGITETSSYGGASNAQRLAEVQQQGLAALQQASQASQLNQARVSAGNTAADAQRAAGRQLEDINKQLAKLAEDSNKTTAKAVEEYAKQIRDATEQAWQKFRDLDEARRKAEDAAGKASSQAQGDEQKKQKTLDEQYAKLREQYNKAQADALQRQHDLEKQYLDQRADGARSLYEAARATREQDLAARRHLEQLENLDPRRDPAAQERQSIADALERIPTAAEIAEAMAQRLQLGPQQITQHIGAVVETGVDFTDSLSVSLLRRVRSGV